MQILLLGNGFDLEHQLPTQYKDFLKFTNLFLKLYQVDNPKQVIAETEMSSSLADFFVRIFGEGNAEIKNTLFGLLSDNIWIEYFTKHIHDMKENWIDFESEISKVIRLLESAKKSYTESCILDTDQIHPSNSYMAFLKLFERENDRKIENINGRTFTYWSRKLLRDLNRVIKALEIYLSEYVGNIKITHYNPDIAALYPTHILSFNYTDTYSKVYGIEYQNIKYDFIHGKVSGKLDIQENNMVLGIDEYLGEENRRRNVDFIEFQKYYQRIQKKTGCAYKEWEDEINKNYDRYQNKKIELFVFGHSLDVTDEDVLREFLLDEKVITTIYYYDKAAFDRCIANLVKVIGRENLIERIYGKNKSIIFRKQAMSKKISGSEFEIGQDIRRIQHLERCDNRTIDKTLSKIKNKIQTEDESYFALQENVITLFDALDKWDLCEENLKEGLLKIAKKLSPKDRVLFYDSQKWSASDYRRKRNCPENTLRFLNEINDYNMEFHSQTSADEGELSALEDLRRYEHLMKIKEDEYEKVLGRFLEEIGKGKAIDKLMWESIQRISVNNIDVAVTVLQNAYQNSDNIHQKIRIHYLLDGCKETMNSVVAII